VLAKTPKLVVASSGQLAAQIADELANWRRLITSRIPQDANRGLQSLHDRSRHAAKRIAIGQMHRAQALQSTRTRSRGLPAPKRLGA